MYSGNIFKLTNTASSSKQYSYILFAMP